MTQSAGEWRARLLLALLSTVVVLALAEVAVRILLRSTARSAEGTPISEYSPTLGWRTRPTGSQRVRREDFDISISMNSRGLRGPETPYEPAEGHRRLAVMGDSFAHGYYAEEPKTVPGRLRQALGPCQVDVLNAGGPGYSTDQEWLYFTEEIRKYRPAEVLLLFYYNDLLFNIEPMGTANRPKPVFTERDGDLALTPPASLKVETGEPSAPPVAGAATFHQSALWAFAAARLQRSRPDWARRLSTYGLTPEMSSAPPQEYLPFGPIDTTERARVEKMWTLTAEILRRFRDDVRESGSGFSVFYVPARFEVNDEAWRFVGRRYEPQRPWNREVVHARLAALLASLDIPFLDATEAFATAEKSRDPAYLSVDGHWNERGNAIAFESLLPVMRRAFSCAA